MACLFAQDSERRGNRLDQYFHFIIGFGNKKTRLQAASFQNQQTLIKLKLVSPVT
jgi:hypothetical protein